MHRRLNHAWLYFVVSLHIACTGAADLNEEPRSIDNHRTQLAPEIQSLSIDELCKKADAFPQLGNLDYSPPGSGDELSPKTLEGFESLSLLSAIAAHQLHTKSPSYQLDKFEHLAAQRLGIGVRNLAVTLTADRRLSLWFMGIPESPRLIARLPACTPSDFNREALLPASPSTPLSEVKTDHLAAYLNLGQNGIPFIWDDLHSGQWQPKLGTFTPPALRQSPPTPRYNGKLSLLTFNTALLDYKIFGFLSVKYAPLVPERRQKILENIYKTDDIIGLQELWQPSEADHFEKAATSQGYRFFNPTKTHASNGLALAIREDLVDTSSPVAHDVYTFEAQLPKEFYAARLTSFGIDRGIKRGFQIVTFKHVDGFSVSVANVHYTAYSNNWRLRIKQAQQFASVIRSLKSEVVIALGDFNGDIHYSEDSFITSNGEAVPEWFANSYSTPLFGIAAGLDDWSTIGLGAEVLKQCYALPLRERDDRCAPTWDHQNTVVQAQYPVSGEPDARLDFIFGRSELPIQPPITSLAFTEKVPLSNGELSHLSDHYGVRVLLRYFRDDLESPSLP